MRQLFYLKQLLNCWIDLLRVAKEKSGVNNNTTLLRQSTGNGALLLVAS